MIRFPSLDVIEERSNKLRIPLPVVVRDIARLVEILNLKEKGFFDARSVLAGGMAMRTYGSDGRARRRALPLGTGRGEAGA